MAVTPQQTVRLSAATENGCSVYSDQDMDETKMQVKSTAGHVYSLLAINMSAVPLYLFVYFKKSSEVIHHPRGHVALYKKCVAEGLTCEIDTKIEDSGYKGDVVSFMVEQLSK